MGILIMKSTAPIRVLRNIGCLGLLFTVTNLNGVEASKASSMAAVNEQIEALTEAEIRSSIAEHLANFLESEHPIAKDFVQLEHKHKKHRKHHKRAHQPAQHTLAS